VGGAAGAPPPAHPEFLPEITLRGENRLRRSSESGTRDVSERTEMTAAEAGVVVDAEVERIEAWRTEELRRAGYDRRAAREVASRHDVDLHVAVDLVRRGCTQDLALQILL
jgi:hypothetical protein